MIPEDKNSLEKQWMCITLIIVGYIFFLVLKINGIFDWSRSYDVENISCREEYNKTFVIDKDFKTSWGLLDRDHSQGESFTIKLHSARTVSGLSVFNVTNYATKNINVYSSMDGKTYSICKYVALDKEEKRIYSFTVPINCQWIQLEYSETEEGVWPITEIEIYE